MMIEYGLIAFFALLAGVSAWQMQKWKLRCHLLKENLDFAQKSHEELKESFKALSHDALEKNNQSFLDLARTSLEKFQEGAKGDLQKRQESIDQLVKPVRETLGKLDEGLQKLEKERKGDHVSLKTQVDSLMEAKKELGKETANLVKALRTPIARGRWGEIQLRRVVEMAGMLNHCDFYEQEVGEGAIRPDLIIKLPGGRQVIIDSKVPLESYLDAIQTENVGIREAKLKDHARLIRQHVAALSKKSYHQHFTPTPEFVVLFLPSETFFSAALQYDPSLIETGADQGVIIATPTTLIALLRAVAYGWKQESLSKHAEEVSLLGHELYKRIVDMSSHFSKMGRSLSSAVEAYNKGIGSLESRVLVTARKFKEMGAAASKLELDAVEVVEKTTRSLETQNS
jgi:DNA recombination protein RmuC